VGFFEKSIDDIVGEDEIVFRGGNKIIPVPEVIIKVVVIVDPVESVD
jgi:hypothetical protein